MPRVGMILAGVLIVVAVVGGVLYVRSGPDVDLLMDEARAALEASDFVTAQAKAIEVLAAQPANVEARKTAGKALHALGDADRALEIVLALPNDERPQDIVGYFDGGAAELLTNYPVLEPLLRERLLEDPDHILAHDRLA